MGTIFSCPVCGWTVVSPEGEADVLKHAEMHAKDAHAAMNLTAADIKKNWKKV